MRKIEVIFMIRHNVEGLFFWSASSVEKATWNLFLTGKMGNHQCRTLEDAVGSGYRCVPVRIEYDI
jgi:hypothetical protein